VEKPWGRRDLPAPYGPTGGSSEPIGEIWYEGGPPGLPLLVKYLFTGENLSVQVHPDDSLAPKLGFERGKDEAWYVVGADAGAAIGIGLEQPLSAEALRSAALDGSIERRLRWHPVRPGSSFYLRAGTIHAIGAGIALVEVQQNSDATLRLYDYGRPRALQVDEAVRAALPAPYEPPAAPRQIEPGRQSLAEGFAFVLELWTGPKERVVAASSEQPIWFIPLGGNARLGGLAAEAPGVWVASGPAELITGADGIALAAYPGKRADYRLLG
jgi:mannose-6-phosphate isomerase